MKKTAKPQETSFDQVQKFYQFMNSNKLEVIEFSKDNTYIKLVRKHNYSVHQIPIFAPAAHAQTQAPAGKPAAPAAWLAALARWGTMSFADVAAPATEHASRGFPVSRFSAYQMAANAEKYRRWPTSAALFLREGRAYRTGEVLVQSELGETLARMAEAERRGIASRLTLHANDWRAVGGTYDRIVSIGMFEHVGRRNHRAFMQVLDGLDYAHNA